MFFFGKKKSQNNKSSCEQPGVSGSCPTAPRVVKDAVKNIQDSVADLSRQLGRRLIIAGACWGTETHMVGLDSIFNVKGYLGDPGLEAYSEFETHNLRALEKLDDVVRACAALKPDVVIVSRIPQKPELLNDDLKQFEAAIERAIPRTQKFYKMCVSPRITNDEAIKLHYDAGFGAGTMPSEVVKEAVCLA